ncbi:ATPase [Clostridium sp. YIM B02515]|uniref:ATPase n=1 Tax=Clostridium rhizosphaerae TaxID=2803861 RepID=A0ABS1T6H0_9CLOT|nr:ATPase [Clostridium rhizosphaerae]MBL4934935.1 ATPase [Clostridium rhizosphaerae]
MEVIKLLEYLQEIFETSSKVPVTGKILVDKKEVLNILDQIINYLPDEFKKAQWIVEEKERILGEVLEEATTLKKESIDMLKKQIENHDISKEAKVRAEEIIASAQRDAKAMRLGARDYADEILCQLEKEINEKGQAMILNIKKQVEEFMISLNNEVGNDLDTIRENIKELRGMK